MNVISYGHSTSKLLMLRQVSSLWWLVSMSTLIGTKEQQFCNVFKESYLIGKYMKYMGHIYGAYMEHKYIGTYIKYKVPHFCCLKLLLATLFSL